MCRFENWLWQHHNPAEVLEDFADRATEGIFALAVSLELDPTAIVLPLAPEVHAYVVQSHKWFRTPLSERHPLEISRDVYPGEALSDDELRWVARHIQDALIPAC